MRRRLVSLAAVILTAGCSDQPVNDQPLLGPTLSPMASPTAEVDAPRLPPIASEGAREVTVGTSSIENGSRMFWDPAKAAFRAGSVTGAQWDDANVASYSTALGFSTTASGDYASALGYHTKASGRVATAMGANTTAQAVSSLVIGRYNIIEGSLTWWHADDPVFVIGNGTGSATPNNAFTVLKNGDTYIDGSLVVTGGCTGCSSDEQLKQNVQPLDDALDKISQLTGVAYDWRHDVEEAEYYPGPQIGLVGQAVERVFPELVGTDSRGYKYVRYQKLVAPLIEAVKELKARNEALREEKDAEIAELRAFVADLAATVRHLQSAMAGIEQ